MAPLSLPVNKLYNDLGDKDLNLGSELDANIEDWAPRFLQEVLGDTPQLWRYSHDEGDHWVVFHVGERRLSLDPTTREKCYHGCSLSVARNMLKDGFVIGPSLGLWFCCHGSGHGRHHAWDRAATSRGHKEHGQLCLWTLPVVVSFGMERSCVGKAGHPEVGKPPVPLKRLRYNADGSPLKQGDIVDIHLSASVELHVNLLYYHNWSRWDPSVLHLFHSVLPLPDTNSGALIMCAQADRTPWMLANNTCGRLCWREATRQQGWTRSTNKPHYWFCTMCYPRFSQGFSGPSEQRDWKAPGLYI